MSDWLQWKNPRTGKTIVDRFIEKISINEYGCWLWTAGISKNGYGHSECGYAHRLSWEICRGPVPEGMHVLHFCDVYYDINDITYRRCACPDHLFLGTQAENMHDMAMKGRWGSTARVHGEQVGTSILTEWDILKIRDHRIRGDKIRDIATEFGVKPRTIKAILHGQNWRWLDFSGPVLLKPREQGFSGT